MGHFKVPIIFIPNVVDVGVYLDWTHQGAHNITQIPEEPINLNWFISKIMLPVNRDIVHRKGLPIKALES